MKLLETLQMVWVEWRLRDLHDIRDTNWQVLCAWCESLDLGGWLGSSVL